MKGVTTLIVCALLLAGVAWYMMTYVLVSEEGKIERVIEQGRRAVEGGSIYSLNRILAPEYQHAGSLDRATVLRLLQQLFNQLGDVNIRTVSHRIHVDGEVAHAEVDYNFTTDSGVAPPVFREALHEQQGIQTIHIRFSKSSGRWRIVSTDIR